MGGISGFPKDAIPGQPIEGWEREPMTTETPEQMDERRAQIVWLGFDGMLEEFKKVALSIMVDIRASDASAGMVTVPVELLAEAIAWCPISDAKAINDLRALLKAARAGEG